MVRPRVCSVTRESRSTVGSCRGSCCAPELTQIYTCCSYLLSVGDGVRQPPQMKDRSSRLRQRDTVLTVAVISPLRAHAIRMTSRMMMAANVPATGRIASIWSSLTDNGLIRTIRILLQSGEIPVDPDRPPKRFQNSRNVAST